MKSGKKEGHRLIRESDYFHSVEEIKEERGQKGGILAVLYDRGSTPQQEMNVEAREKGLRAECKKRGLKVLAYFPEVKNGVFDQLHKRKELHKAIRFAKKSNAVLVVPCIDRLIRASSRDGLFDPLRKRHIMELQKFLKNVPVVSLIPPDTPMREVRGKVSQRGQKGKGNKGGRPKKNPPGYKKARQKKFFDEVIRLYKKGFSYQRISRKIYRRHNERIPISTIGRWVNNASRSKE